MQNQYRKIAKNYSAVRNATQRFVWGPTLLMMAGDISGKDIVDIGCGNGYYTRILAAQQPHTITGIDLSKEMIELARLSDKQENKVINFEIGNMKTFASDDLVDIITAVYAINYNHTKKELIETCKNIYRNLREDGVFCGVTLRPGLVGRKEFVRNFRFTRADGSLKFQDGDKVICSVLNKDTREISTFTCQYWSEATYTECMLLAGFKRVVWHYDLIVSDEGRRVFDASYWKDWAKTVSGAGFQAFK